MVICKSNKFIFLRVPKNASTSLATFFIKGYCGKNDIYSGIGDSKIKKHNFPDSVHSKFRKGYRMIHMTLNEIIDNKIIDESFARECKIIGVLRDPFDRQLSLYSFKNRGKTLSPEHFRDCIQNGYLEGDLNNQIPQSEYLKIGDESVGEWWLYENLNDHLAEFQKQYPTNNDIELPHYKSSFRKNIDKQEQIDYYYNEQTKNAVKEYFAADFELIERLKSVGS